jgi:transposase
MKYGINLIIEVLGMSVKDIATHVGCTVRTVNRWKNGTIPGRWAHYWKIHKLCSEASAAKLAADHAIRDQKEKEYREFKAWAKSQLAE